jgi:LysR family glycine cleavage system transcriptional activator
MNFSHMSVPRIPSLKLLTGFEAAARHGNFSRAAEELHVSPSAISHQVQELEAQLKQPLFRRLGRGVEANVAGEVLLRSVQRSLAILRSGLSQIGTYLDPGLVVVVCPAPLLLGWLQPRLAALEATLPGLCLLLSTDETARFVDEVDVDLIISNQPLGQPGLRDLPLLQDEWVVLAPAALAAELAALPPEQHPRHADLLCLEESLSDDATAPLLLGQLAAFRKRAIYDDARLLLDATLRGHSIACLPRLLADEALAAGRLRVLDAYPRPLGRRWWLSCVEGEPRSAPVRQVTEWLLAQGG